MNHIKMAENLMYLRKKRGVTQEALAEFLGVTKASVSKWENEQSLPDILQLPRIASYYDISIDELMGYQAQLTKEEIRKQYHKFAADFASGDFEKIFRETQDFVKQYYSCYPALIQIIVLWLNHYMLAEKEERQKEVLREIICLCQHIMGQCIDLQILSEASVFQAAASCILGDAAEVIRILEPQHDPKRTSGQMESEGLLIQAYLMAGEQNKAVSFNQYSIYKHLLGVINDSILYLSSQMTEADRAEETMKRIEGMMKLYQIDKLNPNTALQYYLQKAVFCCIHGKIEEALASIRKYMDIGEPFIRKGCVFRGDDYFNRIYTFFEDLELGAQAPRDSQVIWESFLQALNHPGLFVLKDNKEFQKIKRKAEETMEPDKK